MSLILVLYDLPQGATEVLEQAIWEVSESHWVANANALFVSSDMSVSYLSQHLRGALRRNGIAGPILVMRMAEDIATDGLPPDAASWLRQQVDLPMPRAARPN
ncbi:hypothetical protein RQ831_10800 [Roseomonas gilardii]|uniref:Uncharacterized protein n=1 Tax=Roseomonas gilardii TaxID=257708 RepID=A0A1L7AER5_9PROT|nr:hypothetical protein [Roseomonas gilardii]APT57262.1 hypothetical protein RGI145_09270 [Roseomonas gilardii]MDT8331544.1 hypothetical protein [Roseomonas gilardii]PZR16477.1 MAG: hypothetical protein DI532_04960 [Azospirillum brasilense]